MLKNKLVTVAALLGNIWEKKIIIYLGSNRHGFCAIFQSFAKRGSLACTLFHMGCKYKFTRLT